ncbi:MAG: FeoB-associated Cys-rich membrane protein [Thermodesulfobacteriota bacterium]
MLEKLIIGLIIIGAVYYLYRRFKAMVTEDSTPCGCRCEGCAAVSSECESNISTKT